MLYPHVYGINMPSSNELIAHGRTTRQIANEMNADRLIYQTVEGMDRAIMAGQSHVTELERSCFTGEYIAGNITDEYLSWVEATQES